ncbi:acyltransferase family protein [Methylobacterium indicum]|uniref:Acyltransferase n=1 Tax=Methylobacterium indicum TaxID=1775910 RepID=A0ABR5GV66_9HYPH|nr:acyltransferase [Methylobacterium indicum]KMO13602.1 acyltransferase [Methylobacterium indicum]KMO19687.1 acyltransferase [Methylobacterium indicum]
MVTVAAGLAKPHNAFGAVRLALALLVVVSHAFSVTTGAVLDEPLAHLTGYTLGEHAVNGFFAVSGFLVTMSLLRRGPRDYVVARALRIAPGLVAATLAVSLGLGSLMTSLSLSAYWSDPGVWRFIQGTLTTFKSNAALPGVFSENPFRFPMGTVWTLKYEVLCYLGLLAAGLLGTLRWRWLCPLLVAGLVVGLALAGLRTGEMPKGLETSLRLPLIFATGAAFFLYAERAPLSWPLALGGLGLAALLHGTALYPPVLFLAEAYAVLCLGLVPPVRHPALDPRADLSYGTYLYGWPVQQSLHALMPAASAWALLGPSLVLTLAVAALSWRFVERPALGWKARLIGKRAAADAA